MRVRTFCAPAAYINNNKIKSSSSRKRKGFHLAELYKTLSIKLRSYHLMDYQILKTKLRKYIVFSMENLHVGNGFAF